MADDNITEEADTGQQQLVVSEGNTKAFEFLKLPPEIRNKIYWNVLAETPYYCVFFFQPPLTLVSKQIRSESLPVLYGNNKFNVYCVDGYDRYESYWKFPQLRRRWRAPPRVPAVSTIPSFELVTRLDVRYAYEDQDDGSYPFCSVDINIYMRNKKPDYAEEYNEGMVGQSGESLKSSANVRRVCDDLLRSCSDDMSWSPADPLVRLVLEDLDMIVKSLLFFARKCPLATEWVKMVVSAKECNIYDLENTSWYELFVAGPPRSDAEGSGSEGFDSEGSDSEGSSSEGSGPEGFDSEGSDSEGSSSEGSDSEGSGSECSDSEGGGTELLVMGGHY